ncbi:hypothetical protein BJX65DRAFT_313945 [Aspergillus insuetus]
MVVVRTSAVALPLDFGLFGVTVAGAVRASFLAFAVAKVDKLGLDAVLGVDEMGGFSKIFGSNYIESENQLSIVAKFLLLAAAKSRKVAKGLTNKDAVCKSRILIQADGALKGIMQTQHVKVSLEHLEEQECNAISDDEDGKENGATEKNEQDENTM